MTPNRPPLSTAEFEVLKALWEHGPKTVRDLLAILKSEGHAWAYTTVQTLLQRLIAKGYAKADAKGIAHIFRASRSRETLMKQGLRDLANRLCEGTAAPLMLNLLKGHRFSGDEIEDFRRLLDDVEKQTPKKKQKLRRKTSRKRTT